ncbi:hypothetical protein L3Q82_009609 [Scortum barcoo]|uniref:Uncharacterized protein n=1 Tax=Scortum barcoo TaxID=214431 RepID=A0ACB8WG00_9TELE|nr:hypothetical protein L3Q82_009609 [Scortum barcoo]
MVLLLLSYFDEKEDMMFRYVEDTCLAGEERSCYSSRRYVLSVDRNIVHNNIPSFVSYVWELLLLQHPLPIRAGINPGVSADVCLFGLGLSIIFTLLN